MKKLDEMMSDQQNSILLHYQKLYFIGSSGHGKSTTRKRLTGLITNLASLPEEDRKHYSTYLAECTQVLALMNNTDSKLTLQVSGDHDEETRMLFAYMYSNKSTITMEAPMNDSPPTESDTNTRDHARILAPATVAQDPIVKINDIPQSKLESKSSNQGMITITDVDKVIARLRSIVGSGKYAEQLENKVLLNLVDVGGQPGFLEMLPFLSKGPGMFLAFFRLDKDLDEQCEVLYERGEDKITPYKPVYTLRQTLSQILASINYHTPFDSDMDQELQDKLGDLTVIKPVATLVGTFKDKLEKEIKTKIIMNKLSTKFPEMDENEKKAVVEFELQSDKPAAHYETKTDIQIETQELLQSESFKTEVKNLMDEKLQTKNKDLSSITCHFDDLLVPTADNKQFIALDNFTGTETDIDPLREHLQDMFQNFFKDAKLRIRPPQLLLGVILRKEYDIVSMKDCCRIGRALNMEEEEIKFSLWYLDRWVGALIYHPEIEDDWFKENIICSPQVIFDSISSLIVECLLEIHSPKHSSRFTVAEKKNWIEKGQFSLNTVKRCHSEENEKKMKEGKLIPVDKLVKFLEYSSILSVITTKKKQTRRGQVDTMCFIPAILECASLEELTKSLPRNVDTPSPVKITFETACVPIGVFCAMISRLVSGGNEGILGMKWELVQSGVKRNLVSFHVDTADHIITLVAHVNCYEIRVIRQDRSVSLHDLCSYVLSAVLYIIKEINDNIIPIIAFDCNCKHHEFQSSSYSHLCQLSSGVNTCFKCSTSHSLVSLTADQQSWFAEVLSNNCLSI